MAVLEEYIEGLPNVCGSEKTILAHAGKNKDAYKTAGGVDFGRAKSAFAIAFPSRTEPPGEWMRRTSR